MITSERRVEVEKLIATKIVETALAQGFTVSVSNGGDDYEISQATEAQGILENMFAADEDTLFFHPSDPVKKGIKYIGWVSLVYGNDGYDVIADYLVNDTTEAILKPAELLTQELEKADGVES